MAEIPIPLSFHASRWTSTSLNIQVITPELARASRTRNPRNRRIAIFGCAAVAALLCFAGCSEGRTHAALATVLMVRGDVSASGVTNLSDPLKRGNLLAPGATVQSRTGGELDLALLPGFLLHASGNSKLTIQQLRLKKDG